MTGLDAGVFGAGERFATGEAARDVCYVTWYVIAFLVSSHTHLGGENCTGGTLLFVMARVVDRVLAGVHASTDASAGRWLATTGQRRIEDLCSTVTC